MRKKIDRFIIVEALSEGAGGSVYRADEVLPGEIKRPVALKILPMLDPQDKAAQLRFLDEVRLLVALMGHPHIVTVHSVGVTDNTPWIAMEYLSLNLAARLGEQPFAAGEVARMIEHLASGLAAMHNLTPPLLHNDLKPANVLIDACCNYKIADFSLASAVAVEKTRNLATVRYAAPELLSREFGKPAPATDLYALGLIAYEMALGGKLYRQQFPAVFEPGQGSKEATPARWMAWHCSLGAALPPIHELRGDFPEGLSRIIARLTNKPIAERYASATEVLANLRQDMAAPAASAVPLPLPAAAPAAARPKAAPPAAPAGPMPAAQELYYLRFRGRVTGPFDMATLQRQLKQGLISRLHQVSTDRLAWRGLDKIEQPG